MKRWICAILTLALALFCLSAMAGGESVTMQFEDNAYQLTFQGAELADGALKVAVGGFGNAMHMRDGKLIIPFWASVALNGETRVCGKITDRRQRSKASENEQLKGLTWSL